MTENDKIKTVKQLKKIFAVFTKEELCETLALFLADEIKALKISYENQENYLEDICCSVLDQASDILEKK